MKSFFTNSLLPRLALAALIVAGAGGCTKEFLDENNNPNQPLTASPDVLLTGIEATTGFTVGNDIGRVTELLVQHTAGIANQPATYDSYSLRGSFDNQWNGELYGGSLINTKLLIDQNQATNPVYAGVGKLLRAYNFALTTDLWGDVPYSQATLGEANRSPRFDKQEDIYQGNSSLQIQSLFDLVRDGLKDLRNKQNLRLPAGDDLAYRGDTIRWRRFGNTLLLKLANTVSVKNPALARQVINEVLAKGPSAIMRGNTDDFEIPFGTTVGNQNPFFAYNRVNRPDDQMMSRRFLDSLRFDKVIVTGSGATIRRDTVFRNDPRLPLFWTATPRNAGSAKTPFGFFTGYDNASGAAAPARVNRSRFNTFVVGTQGEAPVRIMTNFQRAFILAESAITLGTAGNPQALFQEGIRASMTKAGVSAADITAYFTANPTAVTLTGTDAQKVSKIILQKWIAFTGNGYEAFNDYRRTGYPSLALVTFPSQDSPISIPRRLFYPNSEISANTAQVPTPAPNVTVPVWWATR